MKRKVNFESAYAPSEDIVAREIEGEIIIVPLTASIGDMEDDLFTLNETGKAVWDMLDGKKCLKDVAEALAAAYEAPPGEIEKDVIGLLEELIKRKIIVEIPKS
ncbi:MAG: PqqD family protein [Pseudomonadota bacterium]